MWEYANVLQTKTSSYLHVFWYQFHSCMNKSLVQIHNKRQSAGMKKSLLILLAQSFSFLKIKGNKFIEDCDKNIVRWGKQRQLTFHWLYHPLLLIMEVIITKLVTCNYYAKKKKPSVFLLLKPLTVTVSINNQVEIRDETIKTLLYGSVS